MTDSTLGLAVQLGAFLDLGNEAVTKLGKLERVQPIRRIVHGVAYTSTSGGGTWAVVPVSQQPAAGRIWNLRSYLIIGGSVDPSAPTGSYINNWYLQGYTTTAAAAAAASLSLSFASYVEGFRVDPAAAWPAGTNQVTITNLQGGTQTYDLPGGTTNPLVISFPEPIPAPFGVPAISVPAIVGGPAYSVNAYGRVLGNGFINVVAELWANSDIPQVPVSGATAFNPPPSLASLIRSGISPLPAFDELPENIYWIRPAETLFATVRNVGGGNLPVALIARVDDWPISCVEASRVPS